MTIFLDEEKDDTDSDQEEETEEINIAVSDVNLPNTADRDYDVLETQENEVISAAKEESEPFNLEDLNVSIPNLKYDVDEHFLEILRDKYSHNVVEKGLAICRQFDCYADEDKIVKQMMQKGLASVEPDARQLLYELSALILIQSYQ